MKTNDFNRARRIWPFAAIACAFAIVAFAMTASTLFRGGAESPRSFASETQLGWHAGDEQSYRIRIQSQMWLGLSSASSPEAIEQVIEGTLNLRVFAIRGDDVSLGFQLHPVSLAINGQTDPGRELELATAFGATFSREGRPKSFQFPSCLDPQAGLLLEEVVRSFQVIVPPDSGTQWQVEEQHASGTYTAAYHRTSGRELQKAKLKYLAGADMRDGAQLLGETTNRINRSTGRAVLAEPGSWLESASMSEELVVITGAEAMFRVITEAELELRATAGDRDLALHSAVDLVALIADQQPKASQQRILTAKPTAIDVARFRDMIEAFNLSNGEDVYLLRDLVAYLRKFPELAALIPDILSNPDLVDRAVSGLIHVLELATHDVAQSSLVTISADAQRSHMNRIRAIIASGGVDAPVAATLEQLWQLSLDRSSEDASDLANTALLSLGRLGNGLRAMDSGEYPVLQARLADTLAASHDEQATSTALKAIGNTRDPNMTVDAERYVSSHSPLVRASAAETIGDLNGPTALETLTANLQRESNGRVRAAIAAGLGKLERKSSATFAAVDTQIQSEKDEDSRFALARYLADNLDVYPQGRQTLEKLLQTETEARTVQYVAGKLYR